MAGQQNSEGACVVMVRTSTLATPGWDAATLRAKIAVAQAADGA